jgi:glutamate 5-kinase
MSTRAEFAAARRLVVKIGSSSLTLPGGGINLERLANLVDVIEARVATGSEVVLVSSGAIATGLPTLGFTTRPKDLHVLQAAASVGQGMLIARYATEFARHGRTVGQILLTADDIGHRTRYRNARSTLVRLLELGVVPIVNENDTVATEEIRFGDNDRLAALVAHVIDADALVLLSDVDGLYDAPPASGNAHLITEVAHGAGLDGVEVGGVGSGIGLGGMVTKVDAARVATASGIPVVLTSASNAAAAMAGESCGTLFHASPEKIATRQLWLVHATRPTGRLVLDAGAVRALVEGGSSLLPAGIVSVEGDFLAGDVVELVDPDGEPIARGLVNFDSSELPALLGRSTKDLARELGPDYEREVIHRDDLAILRP